MMSGRFYIDGKDAFTEYGIYVQEGGYNELVAFPPLKAVTSNDWQEEDGIEPDLSEPTLNTKEFSLKIVLSGMVMISCNDIWGNSSVLGNVAPGSVFGEVYACIPGQPMLVTVSAVEDTSVLFMNVGRVLTTCSKSCIFHTKLVQNLLTVCAYKSLQLSQRIQHTSSKSIRGRLMSYFSECVKQFGGNSFLIPYNRQQLADYLNVDRSTMCNELSKMQKDGLIEYNKNQFLLKDRLML